MSALPPVPDFVRGDPRPARAGAGLRLLRAAVFAAACVALAAAGHSLASCAGVRPWALGAGFGAVFVVAAALAGRCRSLPQIAALLATGQIALHTLFGLAGHQATAAAPTGSHRGMSVTEQAARLLCGASGPGLTPAQARQVLATAGIDPGSAMGAMHHHAAAHAAAAPASLLLSLPMLLAHLLAAVAAGWLLRHGELALFRLVALSAHGVAEAALMRTLRSALTLLRALLAGLAPAPRRLPRPARRAREARPGPRGVRLRHSVVRRGPPAPRLSLLAA